MVPGVADDGLGPEAPAVPDRSTRAAPPAPLHRRVSSAVRLRVTDDPQRWARAARRSGQPVTPFHSFPWLSVAARMTSTTFVPLVVEHRGADIGTATWLSHRAGPVTTVNRVPFSYVGPLVPDDQLAPTLHALRRRALLGRAVLQQYQLPPGVAALPVDQRQRFSVRLDSTYVLDTSQDEQTLWSGLSSTYRKRLRQVARAGIEVSESAAGPETLARVVAAVFGRRDAASGYGDHFPPDPADLQQGGLEAHWTVAQQGDVLLGSVVALTYEGSGVLWVGGVLPEHQASNANVLLYWDAIRWAARSGVRTLDLVGVPDVGIGLFKSRFGATLVQHAVFVAEAPGAVRVREARAHLREQAARLFPGHHTPSHP